LENSEVNKSHLSNHLKKLPVCSQKKGGRQGYLNFVKQYIPEEPTSVKKEKRIRLPSC
jgi:hypothetical protein